MKTAKPVRTIREGILPWSLFVGLILFVFYVRLSVKDRLLIDLDESMYLYMAADTLAHGLPYLGAFDHKGPLLYWLMALPISFFPQEIAAVRIFATAILSLTCLFVYLTAVSLSQRRVLSLLAPLLYFSSFCHFKGLSAGASVFMLFPISLAAWSFFSSPDFSKKAAFLQGAMGAAAFFIKMPAVIGILWIPLVYLAGALKGAQRRARAKQFLSFAAGGFFITGIIALPYLFQGQLERLWQDYFVYNLGYASSMSWRTYFRSYDKLLLGELSRNAALVVGSLSAVGLLVNLKRSHLKPDRFVLLFFLFSQLAVVSGRLPYLHYYHQLAIPISLTPVVFLSKLPKTLGVATAAVLTLGVLYFYQPRKPTPSTLAHEQQLREVATHIKAHSKPEDTIFLWGTPSILYFMTDRRAPIRHFHWYFFNRDESQRDHIPESLETLKSSPPLFVVTQKDPFLSDALNEDFFARYSRAGHYGPMTLFHLKP